MAVFELRVPESRHRYNTSHFAHFPDQLLSEWRKKPGPAYDNTLLLYPELLLIFLTKYILQYSLSLANIISSTCPQFRANGRHIPLIIHCCWSAVE